MVPMAVLLAGWIRHDCAPASAMFQKNQTGRYLCEETGKWLGSSCMQRPQDHDMQYMHFFTAP